MKGTRTLATLVVVLIFASAVLGQLTTSLTTSSSSLTTSSSSLCPAPLLLRPSSVILDSAFEDMFCQDSCCVPCPAHMYLFPSFRPAFIGVYAMQSLGFLLTLFIFLSYSIRRHDKFPTNLIKWGSLAIMLDHGCALFAWDPYRGPEALWCANPTTPSSSSNNLRCAGQGFMVVFTTHSLCIWVMILIVNTHFKIVWNKSTQRLVPLMHVLAWGVPTIFAITATVLKAIKIETTPFCTIGREDSNALLLTPLMIYMVPATIMHAVTLFQMARISYKIRKLLSRNVALATINSDEEAEEVRVQSILLRDAENERRRNQIDLHWANGPLCRSPPPFPTAGWQKFDNRFENPRKAPPAPAPNPKLNMNPEPEKLKRSNSDKSTLWTLPQLQGAVWLHLIQTNWRFLVIGFNFCVTIVFSSIAVTQFNKYFTALTPFIKSDWMPCLVTNFPLHNDIQSTVNSCTSVLDQVAGGAPSQIALLGQEFLLSTIGFWFFAIFYRHSEMMKCWAELFKGLKERLFPGRL